jgi:hypothetical protein
MSGFDEFLTRHTPAVREIATAARAVILSVDPDLTELFHPGHWTVSYGSGQKMSEMICYLSGHKDSINLGFARGAHLPDPAGLLRGTGKNMRHIKFKPGDTVDTPAVRALIQSALGD